MSPPQKEPLENHSSTHTMLELEHAPNKLSTSFLPYSFDELFDACKSLLKSGLPTSAGFVCEYAAGLICLRYAGKYGTTSELAGAALGFTWSRMFGVMIISSINQGFSIHAAQLYGARKHRDLGLLLQRNMFVLCIVLSAIIASFMFVESILAMLGTSPEVSLNAGIYIRYSIPSIIGLAFNECLRFYLISQNYFFAQSVIQGGLSFIHILWCELFVVSLGMPIAGAAIAKSITDISCAGVLCAYISYKIRPESWIPWERACLDKWWDYFKKMMVIGANMYVEWVSYEISLIIVTMLHDEYALGAHGIALSLLNAIYMWPLGNSATMQAYVGNAVGEGSVKKAQKFMYAGFTLNFLITAINVIVMLGWNDSIATFFTNDVQTKEVLQTIIFMYGVGHTVDTCVSHLTGILKILGSEKQVLTRFVFFYTVIGVNFEWIFGVALGYGIEAIWVGFIGGVCMMCIWSLNRLIRTDWNLEVAKIQERLGHHKEGKEEDEKQCYIEMNDM